MTSGDTTLPEDERETAEPVTDDPRNGWLDLALADIDGGAAALATAARGGRPIPKKD
ncbi:MAG: hypothetical protein QOG68_2648 [Solirubrobacteraceae bacterium]|jgi:hypothetical protein|nr:hypothetical protein [Solirubrobacteraceae bacterium]